jgi:hypothetical protein
MVKVSCINYCDKQPEDRENPFFLWAERGRATVCAVAYPTADSCNTEACENVLAISADSYLNRPSMQNVAVETISGFINEGLYGLQKPRKPVLCSPAMLFLLGDKARWVVSGNARIYHFQDGGLVNISQDKKTPLFGQKIEWREAVEPAFQVSKGQHVFLLYSGEEDVVLDKDELEGRLGASEDVEETANGLLSIFEGKRCSVAVLMLQKRKGFLFGR